MDGQRGGRLGSFLIGGALGGVAALAAAGRARAREARSPRSTPAGLAAFEQAPCFREVVEREAAERSREDVSSLR